MVELSQIRGFSHIEVLQLRLSDVLVLWILHVPLLIASTAIDCGQVVGILGVFELGHVASCDVGGVAVVCNINPVCLLHNQQFINQ